MVVMDIYYNWWQVVMRVDDNGEEYDDGGWILGTHTYCSCNTCYRNMVVVRPRYHEADAAAGHFQVELVE